ncbi:hypothetical protein COO60DRAFT_1640212 [Scenedesmus sp. NREL 46B-D3]|nr:hypothetical protein COO60DRAFT_1640212 [Scenedesmus sp. NREL 46B-D3]
MTRLPGSSGVDARGRKKYSEKAKGRSSSSSKRASSSRSASQVSMGAPQQRASSRSGSGSPSKVPAASTAVPIVLSEPMAAYVLTATRDYLRLYPISRAIAGDRTVAKRVQLHGRLQFASSFAANGAPALVCLIELEQEVHMQVYTLPNLELARDMPLSALLGWHWRWDGRHTMPSRASGPCNSSGAAHGQATPAQTAGGEPADPAAAAATAAAVAASGSRLASVCAATRHGHLALLGPGSELVRLGLAAGAAGAAVPPAAVYDWDLAAAAHAAASALERQQLQAWHSSGRAGSGSGDAAGAAEKAAREEDEALAAAAAAAAGGGFKGLIGNIGGGLTRGLSTALDATQKGLQKVVQAPFKPSQQQVQEYPHPALGVLFGAPATAAAVGASENIPSTRRQAATAGQVPGQKHSSAAAGSAAPHRQTHVVGVTTWQQQSGGAAGPNSSGRGNGSNRVRTADEIRQAYGRPSTKANETRDVMDETRAALAARGERLSQLQDQTADLAESAAGFAELAKQLADKEKGKTKWFG